MRIICLGIGAALAVAMMVGCGEKGPEVVPVSGVVTYQGKPVEGARVMFHPQEGARSSHGTTDAEGRFELSTFGTNDGALVGKHVVTISKMELPEEAKKVDVEALQREGYGGGAMPGYGGMMGVGGEKKIEPKALIPAKYADKKTSGLEREVKSDGKNEFTFNLE